VPAADGRGGCPAAWRSLAGERPAPQRPGGTHRRAGLRGPAAWRSSGPLTRP
jgi:hypothetical protein